MKKLLFSIGSLVAVVAPVASVIACGKKEGIALKEYDFAAFKELVKSQHYTIADAELENLKSLFGTKATLIHALEGKIAEKAGGDEVHGKNDLALVFKGSQVLETLTDTDTAFTPLTSAGESALPTAAGEALVAGTHTVQPPSSLAGRWGLTAENVKDATFIVYLQNNIKKDGFLEIVALAKKGIEIVEHDGNAAFAIGKFAA